MAQLEFDILGYIHDARQTYGLRAQDYQRYRRFCAHRLHSLRKSVKLTQGKSNSYRKREVNSENATQPAHLELLLVQVERAWAYARDLQELYSRTEEPRQRYHVVRRLRAAAKAAEQLATVVTDKCDLGTSLVAYAYWLEIQCHLHFTLEEWECAMDCAVLARAICQQIATMSGNPKTFALANVRIEDIDVITRLAAYKLHISGAQQSQPEALSTQWYDSRMAKDAGSQVVEKNIPGYNKIATALMDFVAGDTNRQVSETDDGKGRREQLLGLEGACKKHWRGEEIVFTNKNLNSLLERIEHTLVEKNDNTAGLGSLIPILKRACKLASKCYREEIEAAKEVKSSASDQLASSYLIIQMYCVYVLQAIAIADCVSKAQAKAKDLNLDVASSDSLFILDASQQQPWMISPGMAENKKKKKGDLPVATMLVLLYDVVRKRLTELQCSIGNMLGKMSPSASRLIRGRQLVEEVALAGAYFGCVRDYYSAALHASPAHGRYLDALALLDGLVAKVKTMSASVATSSLDGMDKVGWNKVFVVSKDMISQVEKRANDAIPLVRRLCTNTAITNAATTTPKTKENRRQSGVRGNDWFTDPNDKPAMVDNPLFTTGKDSDGAVPLKIPQLVDLEHVQMAVVPIKPVFYDLASSAIDFDMDAIDQKAGSSNQASGGKGSSKLGSILGGLWGSSS